MATRSGWLARVPLAAGREIPARRRTFRTVEWAKPVAPATSRGPQPVCTRQSQIARSASGASCLGLRAGRLERSSKQERLRRSAALACRQRFHQR